MSPSPFEFSRDDEQLPYEEREMSVEVMARHDRLHRDGYAGNSLDPEERERYDRTYHDNSSPFDYP